MSPTALLLPVSAIASEVARTAGLEAPERFGRPGPCAWALFGHAPASYSLARSVRHIPRRGSPTPTGGGVGTRGSVLLGLLVRDEVLGQMHALAHALAHALGIAPIEVGVVVPNVAP